MFRKMRRHAQEMDLSASQKVLFSSKSGILTVNGDDGYPYPVCMNHAYLDGKIYLHSANTGHKIDAIRNNDKVCFIVVDKDNVIPEKLTAAYRSVVVFGRAKILDRAEETLPLIRKFAQKFSSDQSAIQKDIDENLMHLAIIEITPEHITGKEGMEVIRARG